ncbi:CDP-alcohol phosphatidyltransferase family protein [bacterium]|nr:CDP-alcohol phosphatidyltransferase family protein [bacterium]
MQQTFPWVSLGPLIAFNVLLLCTVLVFRGVYRKRERLKDVEERFESKFLSRWMKEYWYWLTEPIVLFLIKIKLTPNKITGIGVLISLLSGYFFADGRFGLGGWVMIAAGTFDMFDGRVARMTGKATHSGAYYDAVMDRVSESATFLGLAYYYRNSWAVGLVCLALVGSFMVSYARAKGEAEGAKYTGGSMQRPERIVYLGVGAIFIPIISYFLVKIHPGFSIDNLYLLPLAFVALMTGLTTIDRITKVMALLDKKR